MKHPTRFVGSRGFAETKFWPLRYLSSLAAIWVMSAASSTQASTITKANNATQLNFGASWTGGNVPNSGDIALWDNTVTASRNTALDADVSFGGIRIADAGGTLMTISSTTGNGLTLGSSGIDMTAATANLTISTTVTLAANQTWSVDAGHILSVSGTVSGTSALTLTTASTGTISITGTNTYSGGTAITAGSNIVINASGVAATPFGTGTLTLGNNVSFVSSGNRYITNMTVLNGNINVGNANATSQYLFYGGMEVTSGTHTINITTFGSGTGSNYGVTLGGANSVVSGPGTLLLANANVGSSPDVLVRIGSTGTLTISADLTIGSGVTGIFGLVNILTNTSNLTVQASGTADLSNRSGVAANQTIQSLSGAGVVTSGKNSVGNSLVAIDGGLSTGTTTFSGNIVTGTAGASIAVTKLGSSTQILSGSNNYTGQTQVNAGTLLINGTHTDFTGTSGNGYGFSGSGHFQVAGGGTLGGSGYIAGNNNNIANSNMVLVQTGGVLAPGSSGIGTLTLDGVNIGGGSSRVLNMATGATFSFELAGNGGTLDRVDFWNYVSGDFLLNSNAINFTLNGTQVAGTYTVSLFRFYSDNGVSLASSGISTGLTIGTLGSGISGMPTLNYNAGGNTIDLTYTVVPEPSVVAMASLGLALVLWRARRRSSLLR